MEEIDPDLEEYHLAALINLCDSMARILGYGRRISEMNIFDTDAARILSFEKDNSTEDFLRKIPEMLSIKTK